MTQTQLLPNQFVPESDWTENYYLKCCQGILFNHVSDSYNPLDGLNRFKDILDYYKLYEGSQDGADWSSMRKVMPPSVSGLSNMNLGETAIYSPGGQAKAILDYHIGSMKKYASGLYSAISTTSIYGERPSQKDIARDILDLKNRFGSLFMDVAKSSYEFKGIPDNIKFATQKAQKDWVNENFRDHSEVMAFYYSRKTFKQNLGEYIMGMQAADAIIAGQAGCHVQTMNSGVVPTWVTVPATNLVIDTRASDDFGRNGQYVGSMTWKSIDEVIQDYSLTEEQAAELRNTSSWPLINSMYGNFDVFFNKNKQGMVLVANLYWHSYKSSKIKGANKKDKYGNYHVKYVDGNSRDISWLRTQRQATLIGNLVVNYGLVENIPTNLNGFNPPLPIITVRPNVINGKSSSMAAKLMTYQRQIDMAAYKFAEHMNKDYGTQFFYDPASYGDTNNMHTMIMNMRTAGVNEINRSDGDSKTQLPVQIENFGLNPSATIYLDMIKFNLDQMYVASNTNPMSMGAQTTITGKGVQENTMAANSAANFLWVAPIQQHWNNIMQYSADKVRLNLVASGQTEISIDDDYMLGYGDHKTIKMTKEMGFQTVGVYIGFDNYLDEQNKAKLEAKLAPLVAAGKIEPDLLIKLDTVGTLTEASNLVESAMVAMREREDAMMAAQAEQQAAIADQKDSTARYVTDRQAEMNQNSIDGRLTEKAVDVAHEQSMADNGGGQPTQE